MRLNQWSGGAMRVTEENDVFFDRPLQEVTLFRFTSDNVQVEPHAGAFSIKFVQSGSERYDFDRRSIRLKPGDALLVNAGERYASEVATLSESFSLFYLDQEVSDALRSVCETSGDLIDNPTRDSAPEVIQMPIRMKDGLKNGLVRLARAANKSDAVGAEDAARDILTAALAQSFSIAPPTALPNIAKQSTRHELITRVYRAQQYIDDMKGRNCALSTLAEVACLSKYHFLRIFRETFGVTPLAYARQRRLETAQAALRYGASLKEAARRSGYSDVQAFERAYFRVYNTLPGRQPKN